MCFHAQVMLFIRRNIYKNVIIISYQKMKNLIKFLYLMGSPKKSEFPVIVEYALFCGDQEWFQSMMMVLIFQVCTHIFKVYNENLCTIEPKDSMGKIYFIKSDFKINVKKKYTT